MILFASYQYITTVGGIQIMGCYFLRPQTNVSGILGKKRDEFSLTSEVTHLKGLEPPPHGSGNHCSIH